MNDLFLEILLEQIQPSPYNPRKTFDPAGLEELAQTIREHGVLEPAVVRPKGEGYELVMGERRFRASRLAGRATLPCLVRDYTDEQVLEVIVIENNQRADVNAAEESAGFAAILDQPRYQALGKAEGVRQLARKLGRSESYVWQRLKLSSLTDEAREELLNGEITPGHAILLARLTPELQTTLLGDMLCERDYQKGQTVRGTRLEGGCRYGVRALAQAIAQKGGLRLENAPFDLSFGPAEVGEGRPCHGCPFRSLSDPSADASTIDLCANPQCFAAKCDAHIEARAREVEQAWGKRPQLVSRLWQTNRKGIMVRDRYEESTENAANSEPAILAEVGAIGESTTKRLGELVWIRVKREKKDSGAAERERKEREEKERRVAQEVEIRKAILTEVFGSIPETPDINFLRLVAAELCADAWSSEGMRFVQETISLESVPDRTKVKPDSFIGLRMVDVLRLCVGYIVAHDLHVTAWDLDKPARDTERAAEAFGVDHARIRKEMLGQGKLFDAEAVPA